MNMPFLGKLAIQCFFWIVFLSPVFPNMAAPWIKGTNNSDGYISNQIDILHEQLNININDLYTADFEITYTIKSGISGMQIPIIFDDYQDTDSTFRAWLDGIEVEVTQIPSIYEDSIKEKWAHELRANYSSLASDLSAFKYFEVNLDKDSIHQIQVNYTGRATVNLWNPVCSYTFEYNLRPAKFWKNFEGLDIVIDASKTNKEYTSNLSDTTPFKGIQRWYFDTIPQDKLTISYQPEISENAQFFIGVGAGGIALFVTFLLAMFHIYIIYCQRKKNPLVKFSVTAIIGSFIIPLIFCISYIFAHNFIDWFIGEHASGRHGYTFLVFFTYPFLFVFYLTICLIIDLGFKKIIQRKKQNNISMN